MEEEVEDARRPLGLAEEAIEQQQRPGPTPGSEEAGAKSGFRIAGSAGRGIWHRRVRTLYSPGPARRDRSER